MFLTFDTVEAFATKRNPSLSFPFLKENGELLSIAANTGMIMEPRALGLYRSFYDRAPALLRCYPQFYRFILGMVLDLETLGMSGNTGLVLCETVSDQMYIDFDTSDCRRLETLSMLETQRVLTTHEAEVKARVIENISLFFANPDLFTKFNRPFFYELTHIIFFLTDYGRSSFADKEVPLKCLLNIGLLALLDDDADLLAETCICLTYLKFGIPLKWHEYITSTRSKISINYEQSIASALNPTVDEYHVSFVLDWYSALNRGPVFTERFQGRTPSYVMPHKQESLLSKISTYTHLRLVSQKPCGNFIEQLNADEQKKLLMILESCVEGPHLLAKLSNDLIGLK